MNDFHNNSRVDKFEKRRKNTKSISLLLVAGGILIIVLLAMFVFGGGDEESGQPSTDSASERTEGDSGNEEPNEGSATDGNDESTNDETTDPDEPTSNESDEQNTNEEQNAAEGDSTNDDKEKEIIEGSDDPNVIKAYTSDWEPIGTEQEGPHTTQFDTESQDWKEMEEAIRVATGIQEGNMITWMIENGGNQKVIGTVTNKSKDKVFQVHLSWIENKGWKPTMVKILKENPYE